MKTISVRTGVVTSIVLVSLAAIFGLMFKPAKAEDMPPAPVEASEVWLKNHAPRIRELRAELEPLEREKNQHVEAAKVFGYTFNWETLEAMKLEVETSF